MEVSIVIPTLNRRKDLKELLFSILRQTKLPKEVIVVDDSDNHETRNLITQSKTEFSNRKIALKYVHPHKKTKSISAARNLGVAQSNAEVLIFIDDDVILDKEYVKEIMKIYNMYPNALGVGGYVTNSSAFVLGLRRHISNLISKMFFLFHREKDRCRVLRSGYVTYPYSMNGIIKCEWLSGTNSSYKRKILKNFQWDENLKEFSQFDDVDISHRIQKRYPDSLYMSSHAKVIHKVSPSARREQRSLIYFDTMYHTYFFYKNIRQTLLNKMFFFWSRFGYLITKFISACTNKEVINILYLIDSNVYALKHFEKIKTGSFTLKHLNTSQPRNI